MKRNIVILGALGVGYAALQHVLTRRPVFTGRVAERTDLIEWNTSLMECMERIAEFASEEDVEQLLDTLKKIRDTSRSSQRSSSWTLQSLISSMSSQLSRAVRSNRPEMTHDDIRLQNALLEDVLPLMESILENVQHNHMLDSLGP